MITRHVRLSTVSSTCRRLCSAVGRDDASTSRFGVHPPSSGNRGGSATTTDPPRRRQDRQRHYTDGYRQKMYRQSERASFTKRDAESSLSGFDVDKEIAWPSSRPSTGMETRREQRRPRRTPDSDNFGTLARSASKTFAKWDRKNNRNVDRKLTKELAAILRDNTRWDEEIASDAPVTSANYLKRCEALITDGRLDDAVRTIHQLVDDHRCLPSAGNFNIVISALGRERRAKEAFELVDLMQLANIKPNARTFTSMLTVCAYHNNRETALETCQQIHELIAATEDGFTDKHYHAIMTVYASHNDWDSLFRTYRELRLSDQPLSLAAFQQMMRACVADKNAGFAKACAIWRMVEALELPFDSRFVGTFLTACRSSGMGSASAAIDFQRDLRLSHEVVGAVHQSEELTDEERVLHLMPGMTLEQAKEFIQATADEVTVVGEAADGGEVTTDGVDEEFNSIEAVGVTSTARSRFELVFPDGMSSYFDVLKRHNVRVTERLVTQLLYFIDPTEENINKLLSISERYRLKIDEYFLNIALQRAAETDVMTNFIMPMFDQFDIAKSNATWVTLASVVNNVDDAKMMILEYRAKGGNYPALIARTLINTALGVNNFNLSAPVLRLMNELAIDVHKDTMAVVPRKIAEWRRIQIKVEQGRDDDVTDEEIMKLKDFKIFRGEWEKTIEELSSRRR